MTSASPPERALIVVKNSQFVNYRHPSQLQDKQHRRTVKSFISRNRKRTNQSPKGSTGQPDHVKGESDGDSDKESPREQPVRRRTALQANTSQAIQSKDAPPAGPVRVIGGLRTDPFRTYPVDSTDDVPWTLDYFIHVFGPKHIWNANLIETGTVESLRTTYIRCTMEHPVVREALVGTCQASYCMEEAAMSKPSQSVMQHQSTAIVLLREKLLSPTGYADDSVLLAIMGLLSIDSLSGNFAALEVHLKGIRRIVEIRGGIDRLGFQGQLRFSINVFETLFAHYQDQKHKATQDVERKSLIYPRHPFSPALCRSIGKLPEGFQELALSSSISVQSIEVLEQTADWLAEVQRHTSLGKPAEKLNWEELQPANDTWLLGFAELNPMERFLLVGIMACSFIVFTQDALTIMASRGLDLHVRKLRNTDWRGCDRACLSWVAIMIAMTTEVSLAAERDRYFLLDMMIDEKQFPEKQADVERGLEQYFWHDFFIPKFRSCWTKAQLRRETRTTPQKANN